MDSRRRLVLAAAALAALYVLVSVSVLRGRDPVARFPELQQYRAKGVPSSPDRAAIIWTFGHQLPAYFDLSLFTLFAHQSHFAFDLHVLTPSPVQWSQERHLWDKYANRILFHTVSPDEWRRRIETIAGVHINYTFADKGRKIADLKPMLGHLFPDIISPTVYKWWIFGDCDGLFGSYDRIFNYSNLYGYDVVSGYSPRVEGMSLFDGGWEHNSFGSWTLLRNSIIINTLYRRSVNFRSMIQDGDRVYAFDENTQPMIPGVRESFHDVLDRSKDVTQCCVNRTLPQVRNSPLTSLIVADLDGDFLEGDVRTKLVWRVNSAIRFSVTGHVGSTKKVYQNQSIDALFAHFLQWKYIRPNLFNAKLTALTAALEERRRAGRPVDCFEIETSAALLHTSGLYSWHLC